MNDQGTLSELDVAFQKVEELNQRGVHFTLMRNVKPNDEYVVSFFDDARYTRDMTTYARGGVGPTPEIAIQRAIDAFNESSK